MLTHVLYHGIHNRTVVKIIQKTATQTEAKYHANCARQPSQYCVCVQPRFVVSQTVNNIFIIIAYNCVVYNIH